MNFVFKGRHLVADGDAISVNTANRRRYCSLVGRSCVHEEAWRSASALARGFALSE